MYILQEAVKNVEAVLTEILNNPQLVHKRNKGLCVSFTKIGHDILTREGLNVRIAGGRAAFSVNKGQWGIIDFGYSQALDVRRDPRVGYIGHFWLVLDQEQVIIDFTMMTLKELVHDSDRFMGLPLQPFNLRKGVIIPMNKVSSFDELKRGKIGWHYQEIAGRGEDLFKSPVPDLPE